MIRLTVMYNLPPGSDEQAFIDWRLRQHQLATNGIPGVIASTFHRIEGSPTGDAPTHRFMTTADWPDRDSFERGFFDPLVQETMNRDLNRITDAVFMVSEVLDASGT